MLRGERPRTEKVALTFHGRVNIASASQAWHQRQIVAESPDNLLESEEEKLEIYGAHIGKSLSPIERDSNKVGVEISLSLLPRGMLIENVLL